MLVLLFINLPRPTCSPGVGKETIAFNRTVFQKVDNIAYQELWAEIL